MKIEKITDTFVNEFDAQTQGCADDCTVYRGKTYDDIKADYVDWRYHYGYDRDENRESLRINGYYCYRDKTPKGTIYW
ncbi:MAG: hypothetical protein IJN43_14030 [Ruminococcus sp.]|nr:hypothetical protein [Ruminococcus sp.]